MNMKKNLLLVIAILTIIMQKEIELIITLSMKNSIDYVL